MQSLGSTLPMLGAPLSLSVPLQGHQTAALSPSGCDTGGQTPTLLPLPSCETLPCLPIQLCLDTQSIRGRQVTNLLEVTSS